MADPQNWWDSGEYETVQPVARTGGPVPIVAAPVDPNKASQEARAQAGEERAQSAEARAIAEFEANRDPAAKAKATAIGKAQGETEGAKIAQSEGAKNLLTAAGVDPASGIDPVADLIRGSTSGALQSTAAGVLGGISGQATPGMENISRLKTIIADMTLQLTGGSLGAGVSNMDVAFLKERVGNLADPNIPANERLAAWNEVKARLARMGGVEVAPEEAKSIVGKGDRFATDQDKALQAALQAAFDAGAGAEQLNAISQGFGRPALQGIEEAIKARDSGVKGIKATVDPTGTGQEDAGLLTAYATGAANALTAGNLDELGGVLGLDPAQIEAGKRYLAEKQGLAYGVGEMTGGAMAALPVMRGAQMAGLGAAAPLAADVLYGAAQGAGEQNENRLGGALVGGTIGGVAGSLLRGGARAIGGSQIAPETQALLGQAEQANIPVMTSDIAPPTTFMGKAAQQVGERVPFVGTGPVRATQQDARQEAVKTLLDDYGVGSEGLTETLAKQFSGKRSADVQKYSGMKNEVISSLSGAGEVPLPKANEAIGAEIARLRGLKSAEYAPAIAKLEDWQRSLAGQSIDNVETLRRQIGESFAAPELASVRSEAQKSLTNIYGPLREDMQSFIRANGGSAAANKWGIANKRLSEMMGELDQRAVKSVLRDVNASPDAIDRLLFSKKPSQVRALYRMLPDEGKATARAAILDRVFKDLGGKMENISPDQFVRRMRERATSTGIFFTGEEAERVNGLIRALELTSRAGKAGVMTETGQQLAPFAGASSLAGAVGLFTGGAATGGTAAATTAATGLGLGVAARILESAPVRNALLRMKASKVGSPEEAKAAILVRNAITAVAGQKYQEAAKPSEEVAAPSFTVPGAQQ